MSTLPDNDFLALQQAFREGDQDAATILYKLLAPRVRCLLARLLDTRAPRLRHLYDPEDLTQEVLAEFFTRLLELDCFEGLKQMAVFLDKLANSHFIDVFRRHQRARRKEPAIRRSPDEPVLQTDSHFLSREPSASQLLETEEAFAQLLAGRSERQQRVLGLKRLGCTLEDIAAVLQINERTVHRILSQLRDHLTVVIPCHERRRSDDPRPTRTRLDSFKRFGNF